MPETFESVIEHKISSAELSALIVSRLNDVIKNWRTLGKIAAIISFANVLFYVEFVYFVDYVAKHDGSMQSTNTVATVAQLIGVPLVVLGDWLADKIRRVKITQHANWLGAILTMPIPCVLASQLGGLTGLAIGQLLIAVPMMILFDAQGMLISKMVQPKQRYSIFAIGYSLGASCILFHLCNSNYLCIARHERQLNDQGF